MTDDTTDDLQALRLQQHPGRPVLRLLRRVPRVGGAADGRPRPARLIRPRSPAPSADPTPDPGASWGAPYGDALPAPVPVPAWPDEEDEEDLVRCPACGIANPSSRTFCQSCGTTLAAAERVEEASHDQIAAAVAMTPPPTPAAGTTPDSPGRGADRRRSAAIPSWADRRRA